MVGEKIAQLLMSCLPNEDRKTMSLCCALFRSLFYEQNIMTSFDLLVYSSDQLNQLKTHTSLLKHTVHLLVLVTDKSVLPEERIEPNAAVPVRTTQTAQASQADIAGSSNANAIQPQRVNFTMSLVELYVVEAIVHVTRVARLVSISVASCNATMTSLLHNHEPSQAQLCLCKVRLDSISADNLQELKYVGVQPVNKVLSHAWRTLVGRAAAIDTVEFRNKTPLWLRGYTNRLACLAVRQEDLEFISSRCRTLRKLLGVRLYLKTLQTVIKFANSGIKLSVVYLVHAAVPLHSLQTLLASQPTLTKVHIENISEIFSHVAPLYEFAAQLLPEIQKFVVLGAPSDNEQGNASEEHMSASNSLRNASISCWEQDNFGLHSISFEQLKLSCCEWGRWDTHARLPNFDPTSLRTLTLRSVFLSDAMLDEVAQKCSGIRTLKLVNCIVMFNSSVKYIGNMANLRKLVMMETTFLDDIQGFSMPQLRELVVQTDFNKADKRAICEILQNVSNVTRLTLLDSSKEPAQLKFKFKDVTDPTKLSNLRWLVTNMHAHCQTPPIKFSIRCFPFLERLTLIPHSSDAEVGVDFELVGNRNEAVTISSDGKLLQSYLFITRTATYWNLLGLTETADAFAEAQDD